MPSTPDIDISASYDDDAPAATNKVSAAQLDSDHREIKRWLNEDLLPALAMVIRDDDTLTDGLVRIRNMHPEMVALLASKTAWQPKTAVACATTANIALTGEQTIDGVLTSGSRVLVKDQTLPAQNGLYVSAAGAWSRATDADAGTELDYAFVFVNAGTSNGSTSWVATSSGYTIGTTGIRLPQPAASHQRWDGGIDGGQRTLQPGHFRGHGPRCHRRDAGTRSRCLRPL
jgi:hypothetical protein